MENKYLVTKIDQIFPRKFRNFSEIDAIFGQISIMTFFRSVAIDFYRIVNFLRHRRKKSLFLEKKEFLYDKRREKRWEGEKRGEKNLNTEKHFLPELEEGEKSSS